MIQSILQIVASLVGVFATYYIGKKVLMWLQAYRNSRQVSEMEKARSDSQRQNQKANEDSDKLKVIDGR